MPSIRRSHLLIGVAVLLAAVSLFLVSRSPRAAQPAAAPAPAEVTPFASPAPEKVAQPRPFKVKIVKARGVRTVSSNLYGRRAPAEPKVVKSAAANAGRTLERYLNAEFVNKRSRFTAKPVRKLLTPQAYKSLRKSQRAALGVASLKVLGGTNGKARARAIVMHRGGTAYAVTMKYRATIKLILDTKPRPLVQTGTIVFTRGNRGWRGDMVEINLSRPTPPKRNKARSWQPREEATS